MYIQSIVYVVLFILSATAVFAASMPISKATREEQVPEAQQSPELQKDTADAL